MKRQLIFATICLFGKINGPNNLMTPERWQQVDAILQAALDLESGAERESFVAQSCAADEELRVAVERLLAADEEASDFIESPVWLKSGLIDTAVREDLKNSLGEKPAVFHAGDSAGKRIGPFVLEKEIGCGGMGSVYLAERVEGGFRQTAAVKLIRRGADTDFIISRFLRERQILAAIEHPYIARLIDGGTSEDGLPYFVMEYVEGEPLYRFCDERKFGISDRLRLFRRICEAVEAAHKAGVVHRDLKPSNILIKLDATPKLLDFGIAKIFDSNLSLDASEPTATIMRMMTPEYASPEQVCGEPVSPASDIYSLGVMLYESLTGHRPYRLRNRALHEIHRAVCEETPSLPSESLTSADNLLPTADAGAKTTNEKAAVEEVFRLRNTDFENLRRELAGDLDKIVLKALRKNPADRYQTVSQLAADIARYLEKLPVEAESFAPEKIIKAETGATASIRDQAKVTAAATETKINERRGETSENGKSMAVIASPKNSNAEIASEFAPNSALAPRKPSLLQKSGVRQSAFLMTLGFGLPLAVVTLKWTIGFPLGWKYLPLIFIVIFGVALMRLFYALLFEPENEQ